MTPRFPIGTAAAWAALAVLGPRMAPYRPDDCRLDAPLAPPSALHWLGTSPDGCDVASWMLHGAPWSLGVGLLVGSLTTATGGALGLLAGVGGRRADAVFLFVCELVQVFPGFLLAIAVAALSPQGGFLVLLLALWLPGWTTTARLVRARVLVLREAEFVAAARAQGWGDGAIARRELLPNLGGILSVQWSFSVAAAILAEAGLSFLGLGAPPGTPSWGAMLQEGRQYLLVAPRLAFLPGALIMGAVLSLQRAGDQLADGLNGNPGGARPG